MAEVEQAEESTEAVLEQSAEKSVETEKQWPDDWRSQMAGGDTKELKRLERFSAPTDVFRSWRAMEQRMSSGELKSALKDGASEEEVAAWRKENGIPEGHDKYEVMLSEGLVIGDDDKPIIENFLAAAHEANLSSKQASRAVQWYFDHQEKMAAEKAEIDKIAEQRNEDLLRTEWGAEYRTNINRINALLEQAPQGVKDAFLGGRTADGQIIGSDANILRWLDTTARTLNPLATVVPGAGANMANAIRDEIAAIEKVMRENRAAYNRDEAMQARLRELYAAAEKA